MLRPARLAAAAALALLALSPSTWNAEAARTCRPALDAGASGGGAPGLSVDTIKRSAWTTWAAEAAQVYGEEFGSLAQARDTRTDCDRSGGGFLCKVSASPCAK